MVDSCPPAAEESPRRRGILEKCFVNIVIHYRVIPNLQLSADNAFICIINYLAWIKIPVRRRFASSCPVFGRVQTEDFYKSNREAAQMFCSWFRQHFQYFQN